MKVKEYTTGKAPNQDWTPVFMKIPGVNDLPIDYSMLKNRP